MAEAAAEAARLAAEQVGQNAQMMATLIAQVNALGQRLGEQQPVQSGQRAAAGSGAGGQGAAGTAVIDPELISKCKNFSGADKDWAEWSFSFESACGVIGLDVAMDTAAKHDNVDA
eukprot:12780742-Alexandrium_andersonii.AAC.1